MPSPLDGIQTQRVFPGPPAELIDYIAGGKKFIIIGHKEPDGDCVGSQLALASALGRMKKEAFPCSSGPFRKSEVRIYEKQFLSTVGESERTGSRVIITDCGSLRRTGEISSGLDGLPLAVIDHHEPGEPLQQSTDSSVPAYVFPDAPANVILILQLMEALGLQPTREEAELLLFGLCTDTGFFRHVDARGAGTLEIAARLTCLGANPQKTFRAISGGKSLKSRNFMGRVLANAEAYYDGRLIISVEEYEDVMRYGLESRDSDAIYQQLQSITGVEAIVLIRQEKPETCTMGLRSKDKADVEKIAKIFGGGGHKNASGANGLQGTIAVLKPQVIKAFESEFSFLPGSVQ